MTQCLILLGLMEGEMLYGKANTDFGHRNIAFML